MKEESGWGRKNRGLGIWVTALGRESDFVLYKEEVGEPRGN